MNKLPSNFGVGLNTYHPDPQVISSEPWLKFVDGDPGRIVITETGLISDDPQERADFYVGVVDRCYQLDLGACCLFGYQHEVPELGLLNADGSPTLAYVAVRDALPNLPTVAAEESPEVVWVRSPHRAMGRGGLEPTAIVLHTMAGTLSGCDAWFRNPDSKVSAHYGVGLTGEIHQYVALEDTAWANGVLESGNTWPGPAGVNPNRLSVSIETEDLGYGDTEVTDAQFTSTLACCRLAMELYPSITLLVAHHVISPHSRRSCPGQRWTDSRFEALAYASGLEPVR